MRRSLLLFAIVATASCAGCSRDPRARLEGKWLGDSVINVPERQLDEALGWVKGVSFEFRGTKMTVTIPGKEPRVGEFDIQDADKDRVTIRVAGEGGGTDSTTLLFAQQDRLHWDIGHGREVVLVRLPQ
jgi:hypothetical protein